MTGGRTSLIRSPCLKVGLTNKLHGSLVGFCGFVGGVVSQGIVTLELHPRSGKILGQSVMNLVGNDPPFVVAGLEHSPKRLPLPLQGLLGPFAIRDVLHQPHDMVNRSVFLLKCPHMYCCVNEIAILAYEPLVQLVMV